MWRCRARRRRCALRRRTTTISPTRTRPAFGPIWRVSESGRSGPGLCLARLRHELDRRLGQTRWGRRSRPANPLMLPCAARASSPFRMRDGKEAYTRAGDLHVDPHGPALDRHRTCRCSVTAARSAFRRPQRPASRRTAPSPSCRSARARRPRPTSRGIKLVNPRRRRADARRGRTLSHDATAATAPSDATVTVSSGMLESSNVNIASAMVNMIELSRRFDLQIKSMHTAEDDGAAPRPSSCSQAEPP